VAESPAVVLIGAPGAGKTRIGKRVAKQLGLPFVDTDKRIVAQHGAIPEIFAEHGEPHFRQLEREQVKAALTEHAVVALGGGAVLDPETQGELEQLTVIQLTVEPEAIAERNVAAGRPLLVGGVDAWLALVATRQPVYDRLSRASFDTSSRPAERIADEIVAWLKEHQ
jgi:shikimate kinase